MPASAGAAPRGTAPPGSRPAKVRSGFLPPLKPGAKPPARVSTLPPGYGFWNLQLNLCNSGLAGCYKGGRSIPEAQGIITSRFPDVVTVNEVCLPDVRDQLAPAMARAWAGDWVFWAFMPAWNVQNNAPYQCSNGRGEYGNGILGHVRAEDWAGFDAVGGIYTWQDAGTNEWRSWVCAYAIGSYYGCGTHLAAGNSTAAFLQCEELLSGIVPQLWSSGGAYRPTVVGGDFNLKYRGSPDIQDCVPPGWYRKGDGDVQHWFITNDLAFDFSEEIGMSYTDHPAWLVGTLV